MSSLLNMALCACRNAPNLFDMWPEKKEKIDAIKADLEGLAVKGKPSMASLEASIGQLKDLGIFIEPEMPSEAFASGSDKIDFSISKQIEIRQAVRHLKIRNNNKWVVQVHWNFQMDSVTAFVLQASKARGLCV